MLSAMRRHLVQSILLAAVLGPAAPSMAATTFWPTTFGPAAHTNQDGPVVGHTSQDHTLPVLRTKSLIGGGSSQGTLPAGIEEHLHLLAWPAPAGDLSTRRLARDLIGGFLPEIAVMLDTGLGLGLADVDSILDPPDVLTDLAGPDTGMVVSPPVATIPAPGTIPILLVLVTLPWTRRRRRS